MKPADKLFWMRVALGVVGGFISDFLGFLGRVVAYRCVQGKMETEFISLNSYNGVLLAIIIYIASYYIGRYALSIYLPPDQSRKYVTAGLGSYIVLYLFTWMFFNTYTHPPLPPRPPCP